MEQNSKTPMYKRVLAIIGILILIGMYINLLIQAAIGSPDTFNTFVYCAAATVAVPIAIWVLMWATGAIIGRHTMASLDLFSANKRHDKYGNVIPDGEIDTVVFDIGNVLVDFAWEKFIEDKGFTGEIAERIGKASVLSDDWKEIDRGVLSIEEIIGNFVKNDPEIKEQIEKTFSDFNNICIKRDATIPWITALKTAGYKVLYLSNYSGQVLEGTKEAMAFREFTDGGILSYTEHMIKPDREIYDLLVERYNLTPSKTVFIDDTPVNVEAAKNYGWKGIVFKDYKQVKEELEELGVKY